jgi:hypothetical protein
MTEIDKEELDNAIKARVTAKATKRNMSDEERAFLTGEINAPAVEEVESVPPPPVKPAGYVSNTNVPPPERPKEDGEIIVIKDQKKRVELSYSHDIQDGKKLTFAIGIPAASVEVQKDGVSILISKDIEIRPPTLTPCTLRTSGKEYSVIFAGATHTIGKYINIPFIIVE